MSFLVPIVIRYSCVYNTSKHWKYQYMGGDSIAVSLHLYISGSFVYHQERRFSYDGTL